MKTLINAAILTLFVAAPLAACEGMDHAALDGKAKSCAVHAKGKHGKASAKVKTDKPVANADKGAGKS